MPSVEGHDTPRPVPQPPLEAVTRTHVHGTVFAARGAVVDRLRADDPLLLVPDPPGDDDEAPAVWVHVQGGDVLGHVPVQVAAWLAPYMLAGGRCRARVTHVGAPGTASWSRVEIELARG